MYTLQYNIHQQTSVGINSLTETVKIGLFPFLGPLFTFCFAHQFSAELFFVSFLCGSEWQTKLVPISFIIIITQTFCKAHDVSNETESEVLAVTRWQHWCQYWSTSKVTF